MTSMNQLQLCKNGAFNRVGLLNHIRSEVKGNNKRMGDDVQIQSLVSIAVRIFQGEFKTESTDGSEDRSS